MLPVQLQLPAGLALLAISSLIAAGAPPPGLADIGTQAAAPGQPDSPRVTRLSDRVRLISGVLKSANVTAIRTSNGIVLIDAGGSIEAGREVAALLAREFPGARVTHIVNTHAHWDHVLGNAAFPGATVVAQENALKAFVRFKAPAGGGEGEKQPGEAGARQTGAAPPPPRRAGIPPPPPRSPLEVHLLPDVYQQTVPDVTFSDRHTLRDGGVTVNLVYYGPAHTLSDLLALVSEEKLLFVGDLYYRKTLPSFSEYVRPDVGRWRTALDQVLAATPRFDRVVSGHGDVIPRDEFEAQIDYLFEVWSRAGEAVRAGRSLESLQDELRLERAFPALVALDARSSTGGSLHEGNVRNAWRHQGGTTGH